MFHLYGLIRYWSLYGLGWIMTLLGLDGKWIVEVGQLVNPVLNNWYCTVLYSLLCTVLSCHANQQLNMGRYDCNNFKIITICHQLCHWEQNMYSKHVSHLLISNIGKEWFFVVLEISANILQPDHLEAGVGGKIMVSLLSVIC